MKTALCVGINDYPGTVNDLNGCVNDMEAWSDLIGAQGIWIINMLQDSDATRENILSILEGLITNASPGDVVVFTYSGHGTSVVDQNHDEADGYDEALYVYDGVLLDDELREIYDRADPDVFIVTILDSCFSGTATKAKKVIRYHKTTEVRHLKVRKRILRRDRLNEVLLTGCEDDEYCYDAFIDGDYHGAFSYYAVQEFGSGLFWEWYNRILNYLPSRDYPQTPTIEGKMDQPIFNGVEEEDPLEEREGCLKRLFKLFR